MVTTDWSKYVRGLLDLPSLAAIPAERIASIHDLLDHGEPGIAVESLCENLNDYLVRVTPDWALALEEAVLGMELAEQCLRIVRGLPRVG